MARRSVKRPAVRVRWELEEYTLNMAVFVWCQRRPLRTVLVLVFMVVRIPGSPQHTAGCLLQLPMDIACTICSDGRNDKSVLHAVFFQLSGAPDENMLAVRIFLPSQLRLMGRIDCIA